jgi:hypothetical protein
VFSPSGVLAFFLKLLLFFLKLQSLLTLLSRRDEGNDQGHYHCNCCGDPTNPRASVAIAKACPPVRDPVHDGLHEVHERPR